jgi:hypothetical protein
MILQSGFPQGQAKDSISLLYLRTLIETTGIVLLQAIARWSEPSLTSVLISGRYPDHLFLEEA